MRVFLLSLGLAACASQYVPAPEYVHGFAEHLDCRGDAVCGATDQWLAVIDRETGDPCGTDRANAYTALRQLGRQAVPFLEAALDLDSPAIARSAAALLRELDRDDLLRAWCASHVGEDVWQAACTQRPRPRTGPPGASVVVVGTVE